MINPINKEKTAIVLIDLQNDYAHKNGQMGRWGWKLENLQGKISNIKLFIEKAREENLKIIHIQMTEGRETINPRLKEENIKKYGEAENWQLAIPGTWGHELILNVKENEKIFQKNDLDMFSNPEIEKHLRENNIETLIILGFYTHACVNASVISASNKGFKVILTKDLVGSQDKLQELHERTLNVLTTSYSLGLTSDEIIKNLKEEK